jgi:anthranilate synthase component 1
VLIKTVFIDENSNLDTLFDDAISALNRMEETALEGKIEKRTFKIHPQSLSSNMEQTYFEEIVLKGKQHIYEGDIFQVVLSQRFDADMEGDAFMLYRALRMVNPSPYLFFLDFNDFQIVGSSPEVLVSVQDRTVKVLPIAGTRPRGKTHAQDVAFEKELLADPKELSEHVMLVDLGRNDLSRVCNAGSVQVLRDHVIERYSHVMHIVSEVEGKLADSNSSVDALMQCFPAGTVSGAPKIRAMEIIDVCEPTKRGIYAGAVGYFDFSGNMDTCIAIRTMVVTNNKVYIQAGAGIVADSDPIKEFEETQNKARALVQALSIALEIQ